MRPLGAIVAGTIAGRVVEDSTAGRVKIDRTASALLRRAGISQSDLAALGVIKVSVTSTGQINLLGSTGGGRRHFISGKALLVPTTIMR